MKSRKSVVLHENRLMNQGLCMAAAALMCLAASPAVAEDIQIIGGTGVRVDLGTGDMRIESDGTGFRVQGWSAIRLNGVAVTVPASELVIDYVTCMRLDADSGVIDLRTGSILAYNGPCQVKHVKISENTVTIKCLGICGYGSNCLDVATYTNDPDTPPGQNPKKVWLFTCQCIQIQN